MLVVGIVQPKFIDIGTVFDRFCNCQVDDVLFVAVDDLPDVVGIGGHQVLEGEALVHEDVVVEAGEALLLIKTQLASLASLDEAV